GCTFLNAFDRDRHEGLLSAGAENSESKKNASASRLPKIGRLAEKKSARRGRSGEPSGQLPAQCHNKQARPSTMNTTISVISKARPGTGCVTTARGLGRMPP